jgi:hypothetical protein
VKPPFGLDATVTYRVALEELPALAELLRVGRRWTEQSGVPLPSWLVARLADIDAVAEATIAAKSDLVANAFDVVADLAPRLSSGNLDDVILLSEKEPEIGLAEVAALTGISRQAALGRVHRRTLPGRKDDRGRWLVPLKALEAN